MDWIEVNGTSLRYELSGSGDKNLVLVHEMGGTLDSWDQVMPMLSPGRRVLRHDWRGAGMSEKLRAPPTFDILADDIAALLDAVGIAGKVALAGCAVGAGIALNFALRHPDRTKAVVAMAPATGVTAGAARGNARAGRRDRNNRTSRPGGAEFRRILPTGGAPRSGTVPEIPRALAGERSGEFCRDQPHAGGRDGNGTTAAYHAVRCC